ncbi:lipid-binding SYLF domain-containing protein [Bizionia gelidisalsuginis]|uniref:Lipid-binding SYLF domain-containing protein n=3 Tax=Flavobacteriaceae TaxID=49546 RepID=A0A8H2QKS0_9FLAO|nr:lipid-binding SYLF domain-containing protein [Bizionia saleffrena]TYC09607.1 lipid-binding SYLF domain-containing protein [Bizionia gelidisalsuginis]
MAAVLMFVTLMSFAQNKDDKRIIEDAEKVMMTIRNTDKAVEKFFEDSSGYVVFPNVGEGALIIGAASGNGVLYENGMAVGMAKLKKLDIGLQAGGEAFTQIIFFENEKNLEDFKNGNFEFSAEAKAVIVDKGAFKKVNYSDGVLVIAKPKAGVIAGVSVGGQKFQYAPF